MYAGDQAWATDNHIPHSVQPGALDHLQLRDTEGHQIDTRHSTRPQKEYLRRCTLHI